MYEEGWGKKLLWIVAIGENQCYDVTRRYTRKLDEIIDRRGSKVHENWYYMLIEYLNKVYQSSLSDDEISELVEKQKKDDTAMDETRTETAPEEQRARISGSAQ